jgi:hypothetical protein
MTCGYENRTPVGVKIEKQNIPLIDYKFLNVHKQECSGTLI